MVLGKAERNRRMNYQIHPRGVEPVLFAGGKVIGSGHVSRERAGRSENLDNILAPAADPIRQQCRGTSDRRRSPRLMGVAAIGPRLELEA